MMIWIVYNIEKRRQESKESEKSILDVCQSIFMYLFICLFDLCHFVD